MALLDFSPASSLYHPSTAPAFSSNDVTRHGPFSSSSKPSRSVGLLFSGGPSRSTAGHKTAGYKHTDLHSQWRALTISHGKPRVEDEAVAAAAAAEEEEKEEEEEGSGIINALPPSVQTCLDDPEPSSLQGQTPCLRLDDLDQERDFKFKKRKPRLLIDSTKLPYPSKPGKRQNVPPRARHMILNLRSLDNLDHFVMSMRKIAKFVHPDRADWLYVIRYFQEREDKSFVIQVYDFVLLEESFEASVRDYTNLMLVHSELGNQETVVETFQLMGERDMHPDVAVYTVLINVYGKMGRLDLVQEKFTEMKSRGLVPDTLVYCALIEVYCQQGQPRQAEMFLKDIEAANLPLVVQIFVSLIRGHGNIGCTKDAERVFQLMQLKRIYPERRSYSALMDAYTKDDDLDNALQVFENMISIKVKPTDKSLARLFNACEGKNMVGTAIYVLEKLENQSLNLGTKTLAIFNGWLGRLGLDEEVEKLSGEMEKRMRWKTKLIRKFRPVSA